MKSRCRILAGVLLLVSAGFAPALTLHALVVQETKPSAAAPAQAPARKRSITSEDAKRWESLGKSIITHDGRWIAFEVNRLDADGTLIIRNADSPNKWETPGGSRVEFSDDSKFAAYILNPPKEIREKVMEERKPVPIKLGIRDLQTGTETIIDDIASFSFRKDTHQLICRRVRSDEPTTGSDLVILNPEGGEPYVLSNVTGYSTNKAQTKLIATVASGSGYTSVHLVDPAKGSTLTVYSGKDKVIAPGWAEDAPVFAFATVTTNEKMDGNNHRIYRFVVAEDGSTRKAILDPKGRKEIPEGQRIAEGRGIEVSKDGSAIAFGIADWKEKKKPTPPKDKADVEIWNTKDVLTVPQQKVQARQARSRTTLCVWTPEADSIKVANQYPVAPGSTNPVDLIPLQPNFKRVLVENPKPYESAVTNGIGYSDAEILDLESGSKATVVKKNQFGVNRSLDDKYVTFYQDKAWHVHRVADGQTKKLAPKGSNFENELDDHTVEVKPPARPPIWFEDDKAVLVQDRFDVWRANPDTGELTRLTEGRGENLVYEYEFVNTWQDNPKVEDPIYLSLFDSVEKTAGFALSDGKGGVKTLFAKDANMPFLWNCKEADRMMFGMQSFTESPNLYVTNRAFTAAKPVSKTNAQQSLFYWGKTELVKFKSRFGADLQGTLIYPADYDAKKQYPMVTYIYERLSNRINTYQQPNELNPYNQQLLSQGGYFVFLPDIAYKGANPGRNAVDCIEPALDAVLKKNVGVDPKKIGLIGHSWGAYQTAFVSTVSDRFAIAACGAPLTELTSMYNSFYWNAGIPDQGLFETEQGRLRVPFWEDPKTYIDNSPVWHASKRKIPILFAFGDADGAVDWHQGQYLYNTLRRMGKPAVMLVYANENHALAKKANQLDYARRIRHYLDVYLKGVKPESWITEGTPYINQGGQ